MSNILDALRKAQDEKTKPQHGTVEGGDNLIARRGNNSGDSGKRLKIIVVAGAALLAVVAWFLYGPAPENNSSDKKQPVAQIKTTAPEMTVKTEEVPPEAVSESEQTAETALTENEDANEVPKARKALPLDDEEETAPPAKSAPAKTVAAETRSQQKTVTEPVKQAATVAQADKETAVKPLEPTAPAEVAVKPVTPPLPPPPPPKPVIPDVAGTPEGITISGIAWQSNPKLRRAVINDLLVGEGALVADVKVVEIKPTAVRLEKNGTVYASPLPR